MTPLTLVLASALLLAPPAANPKSARAEAKAAAFSLSHVVPEDCIFAATWNRWPTPDAKDKNRTQQLLAEESLQDFVKQLVTEAERVIRASIPNDERAEPAVQGVTQLAKIVVRHPGAVFLSGFQIVEKPTDPVIVEAAIVIDTEQDGADAVAAVRKLIALVPKEETVQFVEEKEGDVTFFRPQPLPPTAPEIRLGYRGSQIFLIVGKETSKSLLAKLRKPSQPPAWLMQIVQDAHIDRPIILTHLNVQALLKPLQPLIANPMASKVLDALGVSKLKSLSGITGLDKTGLQDNSSIVTDGPPEGLLDLLSDKPLTVDAFKRVPATATNAVIARADLALIFEKVLEGIGKVDPNVRQQIEMSLVPVENHLGLSVKADLLEALGDTWTLYASSSEAAAPFVPSLVITADVRNHAKLTSSLESLINVVKGAIEQAGPQAPFSLEEFSARGENGYRVQIKNLPIPVSPTWVLTKEQFVFGITPQLVSSHLGLAGKASLAENEAIKAAFEREPKPVLVSYSDPKPELQGIYTLVGSFGPLLMGQLSQQGIDFKLPPLPPLSDLEQHLGPAVSTTARTATGWRSESHGVIPSSSQAGPAVAGAAVALLLPAVQQSREAARRSQAKNNLKQIGLAFHNFHDTHNAFPASAWTDKKGKRTLSWRVAILPWIGQAQLYNEFHQDEPWDSEHNKKLIERMPAIYASPNHANLAKEFKTMFLVPTGKGTAFEGDKGVRLQDFTDGTSNTIMVVEAHPDAAVIWTKPDDLVIDVENPLKGLKGARVGGFHVLMGDGAVRFISENIDLKTLNKLFTRNGGEVLGNF